MKYRKPREDPVRYLARYSKLKNRYAGRYDEEIAQTQEKLEMLKDIKERSENEDGCNCGIGDQSEIGHYHEKWCAALSSASTVEVPFAHCCAEGGGRVQYCDCVNKNHGTAWVDAKSAPSYGPLVLASAVETLREALERIAHYHDHRDIGVEARMSDMIAAMQNIAKTTLTAQAHPAPASTVKDLREDVMVWRPIKELSNIYRQPIWIASPRLVHADSNVHGIAEAYWQDTEGPEEGEWRTTEFDMCNDEWNTITLTKEEVTHFLIPIGPWSIFETPCCPFFEQSGGMAHNDKCAGFLK